MSFKKLITFTMALFCLVCVLQTGCGGGSDAAKAPEEFVPIPEGGIQFTTADGKPVDI